MSTSPLRLLLLLVFALGASPGCIGTLDLVGSPTTGPDDTRPVENPAAGLEDTIWTAEMEGSLGTYVTWFAFEPQHLGVTEELQNGWEPDNGVLWSADGTWDANPGGVASLEWEEAFWGEVSSFARTWTYAPVTQPLATVLYDEWVLERLAGREAWSNSALLATGPTRAEFHGEWRDDSRYGADSRFLRWTTVHARFDSRPVDAGPCGVTVDLEVGEGSDMEPPVVASETFEWGCQISEDEVTGLLRVSLAEFRGTPGELRTQWSAYIAGRYDDAVQWEMANAFLPELWIDPARPEVLAFEGGWAPLLTRRTTGPPEASPAD